MKTLKNILLVVYLLCRSPSGIFSLICLAVMTILTIHVPGFGYAPWVAFFGIVPAILCYAEHKETLANMTGPSIQQTNVIVDPNLPAKGQ